MFPTLPVDDPGRTPTASLPAAFLSSFPWKRWTSPLRSSLLSSHPINTEDTFNLGALETAAAEFIFRVSGAPTIHKLASQTSGCSWETSRLTDSVEVFSPKRSFLLLPFPSQLLPRNRCGAGLLTWNVLYSPSEIIRRRESRSSWPH